MPKPWWLVPVRFTCVSLEKWFESTSWYATEPPGCTCPNWTLGWSDIGRGVRVGLGWRVGVAVQAVHGVRVGLGVYVMKGARVGVFVQVGQGVRVARGVQKVQTQGVRVGVAVQVGQGVRVA